MYSADIYVFQCSIDLGHVPSSFELYGHRQAGSTDCPGDVLYSMIQDWPGWVREEIDLYFFKQRIYSLLLLDLFF